VTDFMNYLILGITRGSMYALIALGYTLVYGVLQLINFAHSEVFMSGAFGSYAIVHLLVGDGKATASCRVR
jgi:branched-chain amino acid transport system permease protein